MKLYVILNDSIPLGNSLETYLKNRGLHHFTQVTNFFTTTSVVSLLTGKLPSDLEEGGIGYHTHLNYKTGKGQFKTNYPWKDKMSIFDLHKAGWDIQFHNANWFYWTLCNDDFIKKTTSMPCTIEEEEAFRATHEYHSLILNQNSSYYQKEKEFIKKIQSEKTDKDKFYFIKNNQFHSAIASHGNKAESLRLIEQWFDNWDFEEEDALFWIFSDHSDFTQIGKLCEPPSALTWAFIKDNNCRLKIRRNYIHITDFYKLTSLQKPDNPDRIYFSEDARCATDTQNSTTAVACMFREWENGKPNKLLQVTYYKPEDKFYGFIYNLNTKKLITTMAFGNLKRALKERFTWIK